MSEPRSDYQPCCGGSPLCDRNWRQRDRHRHADLLDNPATNGQLADFERSIYECIDAEDADPFGSRDGSDV